MHPSYNKGSPVTSNNRGVFASAMWGRCYGPGYEAVEHQIYTGVGRFNRDGVQGVIPLLPDAPQMDST